MKKTLKRINEASLRQLIERKVNEMLNEEGFQPVNDDAKFQEQIQQTVQKYHSEYHYRLVEAFNVLKAYQNVLNQISQNNGGKKLVFYRSNGEPFDLLGGINQGFSSISSALRSIPLPEPLRKR